MDARALLARDRDEALRADQRGLGVAPDRMRGRVAGNALVHAGVEAEFVLAVEGGAAARMAQDFRHAGVVGDQQRAGRGAHEHLDAGRARQALQFGDMFGVFMGAADIEGEIAMHPRRRARNLFGQGLRRRGQRIGVGHFEHGRHAAEHGGPRAGFEVFLVGRAGLAEMDLAVDHARQDVQARAIDDLPGAGLRQIADGGDGLADQSDVARRDSVLVDQHAAAQDQIVGVLRHGASELFGESRTKACMDALD